MQINRELIVANDCISFVVTLRCVTFLYHKIELVQIMLEGRTSLEIVGLPYRSGLRATKLRRLYLIAGSDAVDS